MKFTRQLLVSIVATMISMLPTIGHTQVTWNPFDWAAYSACMAAFIGENAFDYCSCVHMDHKEDTYCTCRYLDGGSKSQCNEQAGTTYSSDQVKPVNFNGRFSASKSKSLCIHKERLDWKQGTPLHLWNCKEGDNQQKVWTYDSKSGEIQGFQNSKMCWHKERVDWRVGQRVHLWACSAGEKGQKTWDVDPASGQIRAREKPIVCIGVKKSNQSEQLILVPCNPGPSQESVWLYNPVRIVSGVEAAIERPGTELINR